MKRIKQCEGCGSRVIGPFCTECGISTKAQRPRKRLVFDLPPGKLDAIKVAAIREGATIRDFVLWAIEARMKWGGLDADETENILDRREG